VLGQHQRHAERRRRKQREGHADPDLAPLRDGAEARRGAEDIERQREADQHHRHRADDARLGPMP
jgi:hypothetical protein